ncbi:PREDICTED: uncharacterized protein LOC109592008, partial [Amphimedon queenslandica]|uniref:Ig-like domain-containing protein n=1 Tax=Amphimedon queenslandica TaxID=400682 RepID=A0AAN0K0W5_AMPQE
MATTGVYWCLVLTECLSLVVSIVVQYSQTVPSPGVTPCPGDRIVLTCTTDTDTVPGGILLWANDDGGINQIINITQPTKGGSLSIEVTAVDGNMITSTATIESVPASLNGTMIGCAGLDIVFTYVTINDTTLHPPIEYYIINVYITTICINSCSVYSYNVTDTNTTITGLSPINEYYTVTIIPVNVIGYGPSVTVNVSITTTTSSITNIMMSTTEYIIMQDKSSAMTALPTITETQLITTTETISSCTDSCSLCLTTTMSQSTDVGFISVAIAIPITGLLTGLITCIISII